jgi:hypothetical protein
MEKPRAEEAPAILLRARTVSVPGETVRHALAMPLDRSVTRVKAMLIAPDGHGTHHAVTSNPPTIENPSGYHRLIGGSVVFGETHREAIIREVEEELAAEIVDLALLGVVENLFFFNSEPGHELIALYSGRLVPEQAASGGRE